MLLAQCVEEFQYLMLWHLPVMIFIVITILKKHKWLKRIAYTDLSSCIDLMRMRERNIQLDEV